MKVYNAVFVRREIGPVKIEVFVLVVSLENKEKKYTEASDMGATPLHRNGLGQLLELVCHYTQLITVECIVRLYAKSQEICEILFWSLDFFCQFGVERFI